jgi:uncharacterized coiled-coil protein SlyX
MSADLIDLEIKLAYQERLIGELDVLVRAFATRLESTERELRELKAAIAPPSPVGPQHELPPHY